jgi:hypothetical protein
MFDEEGSSVNSKSVEFDRASEKQMSRPKNRRRFADLTAPHEKNLLASRLNERISTKNFFNSISLRMFEKKNSENKGTSCLESSERKILECLFGARKCLKHVTF